MNDVSHLEAGEADLSNALQLVIDFIAVDGRPAVCKDPIASTFPYVKRLAASRVNQSVDVCLEPFGNTGRKEFKIGICHCAFQRTVLRLTISSPMVAPL